MREILFRGKRTDNAVWVEGFLVIGTDRISNGKCYILPTVSDFSYGDNGNRVRIGCFVEVDPDTIGQYTGLTDKNGKKIFEGDITTAYFRSNRSLQVLKVYFDNGVFLFDNGWVAVPREYIYCLKVIGNIHDNPKLLKGE